MITGIFVGVIAVLLLAASEADRRDQTSSNASKERP